MGNDKTFVRFHYWDTFHKKYKWVVTYQEAIDNYLEIHRLRNMLESDFLKGELSLVNEKSMKVVRLFNVDGGKTLGVAVTTDAYPRDGVEYLDIAETEFILED